jgi:hypothetical protein
LFLIVNRIVPTVFGHCSWCGAVTWRIDFYLATSKAYAPSGSVSVVPRLFSPLYFHCYLQWRGAVRKIDFSLSKSSAGRTAKNQQRSASN